MLRTASKGGFSGYEPVSSKRAFCINQGFIFGVRNASSARLGSPVRASVAEVPELLVAPLSRRGRRGLKPRPFDGRITQHRVSVRGNAGKHVAGSQKSDHFDQLMGTRHMRQRSIFKRC